MAAISKSERLLNLVSFLLKARRPVTPAEIRESVLGYRERNISAASLDRRFERDKLALRELGVPLKFVPENEPGGPGYIVPRDTYFLPHLSLTNAEAAILAMAGRFVLAGAAGPVSDALQSALRKLQFDSSIPGDIRETAEEHFLFHRIGGAGSEEERQNLRNLTNAVLGRHTVKFSYYSIRPDKTERREVEPYGVGFSGGHWYLVGHDLKRREIRMFRADRIRGDIERARPATALPEFDVPEDFQIQDHISRPPWLYGDAEPMTVRIQLDADVAFMVRMHPAPDDAWEDSADGSGTLARKATNPDALLNWVLGFGRHATVIDPPEFRARVVETLKRIAAAHREKKAGGKS
jgi:predicted DNA-binding transcriptional regulator YafY